MVVISPRDGFSGLVMQCVSEIPFLSFVIVLFSQFADRLSLKVYSLGEQEHSRNVGAKEILGAKEKLGALLGAPEMEGLEETLGLPLGCSEVEGELDTLGLEVVLKDLGYGMKIVGSAVVVG